jgi:small subunit ribosomal protein S4e
MSGHIHRIASPRIYPILRKESHYIVKVMPGPHPKERSLPLLLIVRDVLGITETARETKKVLNDNKVQVDKKFRKEMKFPVGLMDIISIPDINKNYRFLFNEKGDVKLIEIDEKESNIKPCKIVGKTLVKGGKIQLTLHDGRNIIVDDNKYKTGDTLIITLPNQEIKSHFPLDKGVVVYISDGTHRGEVAKVVDFKAMPGSNPDRVLLEKNNGEQFETLKKYVFVIGKDKPEIKIGE